MVRHVALFLAIACLSVATARADGPAVSQLNGKVSAEGGVTGTQGDSSAVGTMKGSVTTPLGHALGFQLDGVAGMAYGQPFGGGTAHLFWRDPSIGLFGPVVSLAGDDGARLSWYGAEAELYIGKVSLGAWGGYHNAVIDEFALGASSAYFGGDFTFYPVPDLALSIAATSEFSRITTSGTIEFQPDLLARHNVSFYATGEVAPNSTYTVTAGIRLYFGADKPLIRRHREDDPATASAAAFESAFALAPPPPVIAANRATLQQLVATNFLGQNTPAIHAAEQQYEQMWAQDVAAMYGSMP